MNSKILNHIKKVIAALAVIVICSPHAAYAMSWYNRNPNYKQDQKQDQSKQEKNLIDKLIELLSNTDELKSKLKELYNFLKNFISTGSNVEDAFRIRSYINTNIPEGDTKDELLRTTDTYVLLASSGNSGFSIGSLIGSLMSILSPVVDTLMGVLGGNSIDAEAISVNIESTTASQFTDGKYKVNLHANVYINPKDTEGKWALVIHPFLMSGKTMANAVGSIYYEKGYNVFAIDLRGFGDSEGTVALGFLEALDAYDWLVYMNNEFKRDHDVKVNEIIVHGTSLGAATTNFLSGIDGMLADKDAPKKMDLKYSLTDLNVIRLVEDCGYKDMEQFAEKDFIISLGMGLDEDNFDYYSNALNSLKYCEIPMLIIHGDADMMVNYKDNAPVIAETVKDSRLVTIDGGAHALIMMGNNKEYVNAVNEFIEKGSAYEGEKPQDKEEKNQSILDLIFGLLKIGK